MKTLSLKRWILTNALLFMLMVLCILVFSVLGRPLLDFTEVLHNPQSMMADLFYKARLPRVLLGTLVGASLSASGVAFQSLLRNPLADPYVLGVSGGAALGAVIAFMFGLSYQWVSLIAFMSGLASLFFIYWLARVDGRLPVHSLLLVGVIFNAFSFALILLANALAPMGEAHQIFFILMGSLEAQSLSVILWMALLVAIGLGVLIGNSPQINLVSLGEDQAAQLGLNVDRHRKLMFVAGSLMVGACVAVAGLIGFVGLFVPHIMRLVFGNDNRILIPASAMAGGVFLVACDFLARTLFAGATFQTQLPVGVVTALLGGPLFVYLMKQK